MKEILKLWYSGAFKKDLFKICAISAVVFLTSYTIVKLVIIPNLSQEDIFVGYFMLAILCAVYFSMALWVGAMGPLFAIIRFKKQFSFLPPTTREGRIAMQPKVDFELHQAAKNFFFICNEEERLVSLLINKNLAPALQPDEIRATEIAIDDTRKTVKKFKKQFWQKHATARRDLLPAAFEVYPSIHNYETNPPQKTVPKKKKLTPPSLDMLRHAETIDSLEKRTRSGRIKWEEV